MAGSDQEATIGLALSGGGSRAIAFHLGCMRALNELGLLDRVNVISTVSGGSVIGGLYALSKGPFSEFEKQVRTLLERGLEWPVVRTAFLTMEGPKAFLCWIVVGVANIFFLSVSLALNILLRIVPSESLKGWNTRKWHPPIRRFASRTTILRRAMDDELFKGASLEDLGSGTPLLLINAADLRTGSAFYFSAKESGSWRLGRLANRGILLAHAVTASAAYPLFLPALDERISFRRRDESFRVERVTLTDGGIYDNLGLAPLWPNRDPSVSLNVIPVDTIICCRAGYGIRTDPPSQFMLARLKSAFFCVHDRAQNAAVKRLFDLHKSGKLRNFIVPHLGQDDSRLKFIPTGLITREEASAYPTNFSAMSPAWIERLSGRGEQLTKALIAEHAPTMVRSNVPNRTA